MQEEEGGRCEKAHPDSTNTHTHTHTHTRPAAQDNSHQSRPVAFKTAKHSATLVFSININRYLSKCSFLFVFCFSLPLSELSVLIRPQSISLGT